MTNLLLLMLVYLTYAGVSFWLFNCNFLSPSFVFSLSIAAMLCLAYYTAVNLGMLFAIELKTFTIFAVAGFVFLATEFFVYAFHTVDYFRNRQSVKLEGSPQPLDIHPQIQWAFTAFLTVSLLIALAVLYINTGGGSWSQRMRAYREMLLHNPDTIRFRFIVAQIFKVNIVVVDLFAYVLLYNASVCGVPVKQLISYVIDVFLYIIYSAVVTGSRQVPLEEILFLLMIYIIINVSPERKKKLGGFILKLIPLIVILGTLFTNIGILMGRYETQKSRLQDVAEYTCGGLYSFNLHLDREASTKMWGQATFAYVYMIPQNMGLMPRTDDIMTTGEFDMYGNTITIFGRWYRDFGTIGVYVMTCLVSMFYSRFFYKRLISSSNKVQEHHIDRILYCYLMPGLIWAGYDDRIAALMTVQTVFFLVFIYVLYRMLIVSKYKLF